MHTPNIPSTSGEKLGSAASAGCVSTDTSSYDISHNSISRRVLSFACLHPPHALWLFVVLLKFRLSDTTNILRYKALESIDIQLEFEFRQVFAITQIAFDIYVKSHPIPIIECHHHGSSNLRIQAAYTANGGAFYHQQDPEPC